ncbi:RdgB/HAM1 family non-canonical purine NTP pyrophosphatase [Jannaschia seohaensis]|uniref:dITP/XTP pyrophosphatase n=1 Tax=Jannaschia seohaensis TaxID=475081 RepID=A0A2Y9A0H5_9RHOB|nr:RdgB/HAM1 family non-canonical purine NTP pyrophosphatase [Jannaschia seohaensis]PWJ21763.1 XTP/dITP diphosphohydrolase [Jannaschia seohaensis]SSA38041.1 XTP/dITP diphosphohydrolase [Jannaschia seohaensis]
MKPLGDTLLIATHNAGKLEEFSALFAPLGITCRSNADFGLAEPEEIETTFLGNARIKARAAVAATGLAALADDSGLEVEALDGQPGIHTADWAETPTGRDFMLAMTRTHDALIARAAPQPWRARFRATLVMLWPDGSEAVFEGDAPGRLIWPIRGQTGHGYDPMFIPDGHDRTFAEMPTEEKNAISHRARAMAKLKAALDAGA